MNWKQLSEMRDSFNLDAKQHVLQYFNAEDEVLTRVVETASLTLTLSKRTVKVVDPHEEADMEGFYQELLILLPELEDKLKILRQKYTKIIPGQRQKYLHLCALKYQTLEKSAKVLPKLLVDIGKKFKISAIVF